MQVLVSGNAEVLILGKARHGTVGQAACCKSLVMSPAYDAV